MFEIVTRSVTIRPVLRAGSAAARITLRPFGEVASAGMQAGLGLGRREMERVLESPELPRLAEEAFDSRRFQAAVARGLESEAASRVVSMFFQSSLFEEIVDRLLESPQLWRLVEEIVDSPAVTAAITGQGLGFADQVGEQVRARSRRSDELLERLAHRFSRRHPGESAVPDGPPLPDAGQGLEPGA